MRNSKKLSNQGLIGLLMVLVVAVAILVSINGGSKIWEQLKRPANIWNSMISNFSTSTINSTDVVSNASTSANVDTSGWKTYTNTELGLSFKYPPEWTDVKVLKEDYRNILPKDNEMGYKGQAINIFFSTSSQPGSIINERPAIYIRSADYWGYTMSGFTAEKNCQNSPLHPVYLCRLEKINGKDSIYAVFAAGWPEGDGTMYGAQSQFFNLANTSFPTLEILEIVSGDWDKDWIIGKDQYGNFDFQKYNENIKKYAQEMAEGKRNSEEVKLFKTFISTFKLIQ